MMKYTYKNPYKYRNYFSIHEEFNNLNEIEEDDDTG